MKQAFAYMRIVDGPPQECCKYLNRAALIGPDDTYVLTLRAARTIAEPCKTPTWFF
jgi:hypothetical protein